MMKALLLAAVVGVLGVHQVAAQNPGTEVCTSKPIDLIFVIDGSGSICDTDTNSTRSDPHNPNRNTCDNWENLKEFVARIMGRFPTDGDENRIGIVVFGPSATIVANLTGSPPNVSTLAYIGGTTDAAGALRLTKIIFEGPSASTSRADYVIFISDGKPTVPDDIEGRKQAIDAAEELHDIGVKFLSIGITDLIEEGFLAAISSYPHTKEENYFTSPSYDELEPIIEQIVEQTCTSPCDDRVIDMAFVVDSSGSICDNDPTKNGTGVNTSCSNWRFVREFVTKFVKEIEVGTDASHIMVSRFGTDGDLIANLTECSHNNTVARECVETRLTYSGGTTNTKEGLLKANEQMCSGRRQGVPCAVVLLTDGKPTVPFNETFAKQEALLESQRLQGCDCKVFVVGVTNAIDIELVRDLSSTKVENETYFTAPTFESLVGITSQVIEQSCGPDCRVPPDVCIMVDGSGSIGNRNFGIVRTYVASILDKLGVKAETDADSRAAVVLFSDQAEVVCDFGDLECINKVNSMRYPRGRTNTNLALDKCVELFGDAPDNGKNLTKIGVIITDGGSQNQILTSNSATTARATMEIVAVGVGWADYNELNSIASHHYSQHVVTVNRFSGLTTSLDTVVDKVCKKTSTCQSAPCRNGGTCVERVDDFICHCTNGWAGPRCQFTCRMPPDAVFGLDASGSVRQSKWLDLVDFAKEVSLYLPFDGTSQSQLGLHTFSDNFQLVFNLNNHYTRTAILDQMTIPNYHGGSTDTAAALMGARTQMFTEINGDRSNFQNVDLLFLDGKSNDFNATFHQARMNRMADIINVAVGVNTVGKPDYQSELQAIGGRPQNVFTGSNFNAMKRMAIDVASYICNNDNACSSGPCMNGGECVDTFWGYRCDCPSGFSGMRCERGCPEAMDIVIVLDCSSSIRNELFDDIKNFLVRILSNYRISSDAVRVAFVSFADASTLHFCFNDYTDYEGVAAAIRKTLHCGGRTNLASALRVVHQMVFTDTCGDRSNVPNMVYVFSDGGVNEEVPNTVKEAVSVKITGAHLMAMAIGDANRFMLESIVSESVSKNYMHTKFVRNMLNMLPMSLAAACNDADDCDGVTCQNGGTCRDGLDSFTCDGCRQGFTGELCQRSCNRQKDVVFVLDASGSMEHVCTIGIKLLEYIAKGLDIRAGRTNVAFIQYQSTSVVEFDLQDYSSKEDVLLAMSCSRYGGRTNTAAALRDARSLLTNQGRSGVDKVVVLATDAQSNIDTGRTLPDARAIKNLANSRLFVAGISMDHDEDEAVAIASDDSYFAVPAAGNTMAAAELILDAICQ